MRYQYHAAPLRSCRSSLRRLLAALATAAQLAVGFGIPLGR